MKTIVCNLQLFDLYQTVQLFDEQGHFENNIGVARSEELSSLMLALCTQYNINQIHLFGNKSFAEKIRSLTLKSAKEEYNLNNIEIEVN